MGVREWECVCMCVLRHVFQLCSDAWVQIQRRRVRLNQHDKFCQVKYNNVKRAWDLRVYVVEFVVTDWNLNWATKG